MDVSISNSNDIEGLSKLVGNDIQIINIKFREDLHFVQMSSKDESYRAFSKNRKKAIGNVLKIIHKFHS